MAQLYDQEIDSIEFFTGVIADTNPDLKGNLLLGDVQLIDVSLLALQDYVLLPAPSS
jgi:hypothetical protein